MAFPETPPVPCRSRPRQSSPRVRKGLADSDDEGLVGDGIPEPVDRGPKIWQSFYPSLAFP